MKLKASVCVAICLAPGLAVAQAAPEHHVWQDKGSFEPMSHTAQAIMGQIKLSGNTKFATAGSTMRMTFSNGQTVKLTSVEGMWRVWDDADKTNKQSAEIFRLDRDPGKLLYGNTLCGDPARYIAFYETFFFDRMYLKADVFQSVATPADVDSPGLCGTYSFNLPIVGSSTVVAAIPVPAHPVPAPPSSAAPVLNNEVRTVPALAPGVVGDDNENYDKMARVFIGNPSRAEIVSNIKTVLRNFKQPHTDYNIGHLGSVLVRMRLDTKVPEMSTLECMISLGSEFGSDYAAGAGLCAAAVQTGVGR